MALASSTSLGLETGKSACGATYSRWRRRAETNPQRTQEEAGSPSVHPAFARSPIVKGGQGNYALRVVPRKTHFLGGVQSQIWVLLRERETKIGPEIKTFKKCTKKIKGSTKTVDFGSRVEEAHGAERREPR